MGAENTHQRSRHAVLGAWVRASSHVHWIWAPAPGASTRLRELELRRLSACCSFLFPHPQKVSQEINAEDNAQEKFILSTPYQPMTALIVTTNLKLAMLGSDACMGLKFLRLRL